MNGHHFLINLDDEERMFGSSFVAEVRRVGNAEFMAPEFMVWGITDEVKRPALSRTSGAPTLGGIPRCKRILVLRSRSALDIGLGEGAGININLYYNTWI